MKSRVNFYSPKKVSLIISCGLVIWIIGIILTPLLAAGEWVFGQKIAAFGYFFYQPVCHQIPERSFWLSGYTLPVCARCFSFYLGGLLITGYYIFKDKIQMWNLTIYILLVLPVALDFLLEKFDLYTNLSGLRFTTGLMLGIVIFQLFVVSFFANSIRKSKGLI
jgi:uncharacterized membrane protein